MKAKRLLLETLIKHHEIFDSENENNARTVVFCTSDIFNERHEPKKQNQWFQKKYDTASLKSAIRRKLNFEFLDFLDDVFETVIIDETHVVKSAVSDYNVSIQWLKADFILCVTNTPLKNSLENIDEYIVLCESDEAEKWWENEQLTEWHVNDWINSYTLRDDHPAARLRLTKRAVNEFIARDAYDQATLSSWLSQIFKKMLLKRTHASRLPFDIRRRIGQNLPRCQAYQIKCRLSQTKFQTYQAMKAKLLKNLSQTNARVRKSKWSFAIQRKFSLMTVCSLLLTLEERKVDLKAKKVKKMLATEDYLQE